MTALIDDLCTEHGVHKFYTDASEQGLPPGSIPSYFSTNLGNKRPFILTDINEDRFKYHQESGCCTLVVWND